MSTSHQSSYIIHIIYHTESHSKSLVTERNRLGLIRAFRYRLPSIQHRINRKAFNSFWYYDCFQYYRFYYLKSQPMAMTYSIFVRKKPERSSSHLWHPSIFPRKEFERILSNAAKNPALYDIEFLFDSVSASKGKTLKNAPMSMVLDITSLLNEFALDNTRCMKAFQALDAFSYPLVLQWGVTAVCIGIVEAIGQRFLINHINEDIIEYTDNFMNEIPDQLLGNEGIWRTIFSYHYSSEEENYKILKKAFQIMAPFSLHNPSALSKSKSCFCRVLFH